MPLRFIVKSIIITGSHNLMVRTVVSDIGYYWSLEFKKKG